MLHFEVEKKNPLGIFFLTFFSSKCQFKFFSDIPEFQVGGPVNQQIKNMWPINLNHRGHLLQKCNIKIPFLTHILGALLCSC
jgi:hypothetical protein